MKVRYIYFLMVVRFFYFPDLAQAVPTLDKPTVPVSANKSSTFSYPHPLEKIDAMPPSNKINEAVLLNKEMRMQAVVQRSWISSMVVPGLGQIYNKDYWKVPLCYLGFALVFPRIYSEHKEMHNHKRTLLMTGDNKPSHAYTEKRIKECERTRNLFIIIASAWYLLNILDAYAGGHDQFVNFKDDIETTSSLQPTALLKPISPKQ